MSDLIETFANITGSDEATSAQFLDMSGYNLEVAIQMFFGESMDPVEAIDSRADSGMPGYFRLMFSKDAIKNGFPEAWAGQGLRFDAVSDGKPFSGLGLRQPLNGPCGVLAVYQGTIISNLISDNLLSHDVIVADKIIWNVWLIMILKRGFGWLYITPLRKSYTPPSIILRNCMKLRKIESNNSYYFFNPHI